MHGDQADLHDAVYKLENFRSHSRHIVYRGEGEVRVSSRSKRQVLTGDLSLNRHICNGWKTGNTIIACVVFALCLVGRFCSREKEVVLFCLASTPIVFRSKH